MSTWRRKALELFPDLRSKFQARDANIYTVFFALLPRCRQAHRAGDDAELRKIYDYAEWCFRQKPKDLWNAAGVAFYEHLVDDEITRREISKWVKPDVFRDLAGLFEWRLGPERFQRLLQRQAKHQQLTRDKEYQDWLRKQAGI